MVGNAIAQKDGDMKRKLERNKCEGKRRGEKGTRETK